MIKMEYKITEKFSQEHIDEILRIHNEEGLTAETLLENSKDKDNIFHNLFEWDNKSAGEKWRLQQARLIINEIRVTIGERELYAFENIRVNINPESNQSNVLIETNRFYEPIIEILNDEDKKKQLIDRALREINYWKQRNIQLNELRPIFKAIEKTTKKVK